MQIFIENVAPHNSDRFRHTTANVAEGSALPWQSQTLSLRPLEWIERKNDGKRVFKDKYYA